MNILITAGNTQAMIDRVRCITNTFSGRTGAQIALAAVARGHRVSLLTSQPDAGRPHFSADSPVKNLDVQPYRTFEDLREFLYYRIHCEPWDAIIHAAAVSDYLSAGAYVADKVLVKSEHGDLHCAGPLTMSNRSAAKVQSDEPELWLRLVQAPKLIDMIRGAWQYRGVLVKFKLEVAVTDMDLVHRAERSRLHSNADLMVANTLEDAGHWAFIGAGTYERIPRNELAAILVHRVERLCRVPPLE